MSSVPESTVLGEWAGEGLQATLAEYLRRRAERATEALGGEGRSHVAAIEALQGFVRGLSLYDPRMWSLSLLMGAQGDKDEFLPGEKQQAVLSRVAAPFEPPAPPLDVLLNELVGAGIDDLVQSLGGRFQEADRLRAEAEAETKALRLRADAGQAAEDELRTVRSEFAACQEELAEEKANAVYLRKHLNEDGEKSAPKSSAKKAASKPRRTKVPAHTGVYYFENAAGERVYEIGVPKGEGKTQWIPIGLDLQEAIERRKELVGGSTSPSEAEKVAA